MYTDPISEIASFNIEGFVNTLMPIIWGIVIITLIFEILKVIFLFKIFKKAQEPVIASIIPVYNMRILIKMAKLPSWYLFLMFIPFVGIYAFIKVKYEITKLFGYGSKMALIYILIPPIALYMFAFKSEYKEIKKEESKSTIDLDVDLLANFKPVIGENAVPFENNTEAYFKQEIPSNVELKIENDIPKQEEIKQAVETPEQIRPQIVKTVPLEENIVSYQKPVPKTEIVDASLLVKQEEVKNPIEEAETIVIPKGDQVVGNVIVPDGVIIERQVEKIPVVPLVNEKESNKICPECGIKIDVNAKTCFMCGYKFEN